MAKKLWGGRFKKEIDKDFFEFQKSIQYDYKLAGYDIAHSLIHALALGKTGILKPKEKTKLIGALKKIGNEIKQNKFKYESGSEDIHTDIQNKIEKKIGKLALKLHTLRSRNDQVAFDEKFYCHVECKNVGNLLENLLKSIVILENKYKNVSVVGYTHTQRAQKINFKDYLCAFYCMFERDKKRLNNFLKNLEVHIGAGALLRNIKKEDYGKAIKEYLKGSNAFIKPSENTIDDVSDRDFIIELLSILSIIQMHLSRLSEDFILYSTKEFGFMELPEEFCTGSSLMPHKKNPDFLELVRGYTGRIYGNLISILTTMKGLPLTYNRDMQLDKEPLFSSVEIVKDEIAIMSKFIKGVKLNELVVKEALKDKNLYSVDRAKELVLKGMPFRQAHDKIGKELRGK
ncbi:MAG: argininosuccinate lyase [Candidatus Omnitrophica bacterium]|nr:argininosuccinate lyase [Candidatus Omnitrophota bacterium]MDD5352687.1 argininosuccinate lyase [Candidatus Omnitrophota bacterium]MDD5550286.1 argininosuccinate lyase [Candidatus Omnitrophota bacterium]